MIDTKRLAGCIIELTKEPIPEQVWDDMADIAVGPESQLQVIMGMAAVAVLTFKKSGKVKDGAFVGLIIEAEQEFRVCYQIIVAFLNDDKKTGVALSVTTVNQGMEWADRCMFAMALVVRKMAREFMAAGGRLEL